MSTHYTLLGVHRRASTPAIKHAYRELARIHHPDKGGDPEVFKCLNEAYATLSDPERRKLYDFNTLSISELFEGPPDPLYTTQPSNTIQSVYVRLGDLCIGSDVIVPVSRTIVDEKQLCPCHHCNGTGVSYLVPDRIGGFLTPPRHAQCNWCTAGYVPESIVIRRVNEEVLCTVPPGCPPGMLFCFRGKGDQVPGSVAGDLVVRIECLQSGPFRVQTDTLDLVHTLTSTLYESLVGFVRTLLHPDGNVLRICSSTVTLPGMYTVLHAGLHYRARNRCGHLLIHVQVTFPDHITTDKGSDLASILGQEQTDAVVVQSGDILLDATHPYVPTSVVDILQENNTSVYSNHDPPGCKQM
jgi:DnaJ family protein A protein 2